MTLVFLKSDDKIIVSRGHGVRDYSVKDGASIMAYNNNRFGNQGNKSQAPAQARPATTGSSGGGGTQARGPKPEIILSSGLFKPKSEKSKAVASVVTEITQDIPAGTTVYLDLYQNEVTAEGKPLFKIQLKKKLA